ncbi:MAG: hypothetical protein IPM46_15735 [Flavobacteriales bacterium]|nr:hypothetical protein [Flavobacteriales bacterium]
MKTRNILALLLLGTAILTNGGLFKLLHWPGANVQFLIGAMLQTVMLLVLALKLAKGPSMNPLLER